MVYKVLIIISLFLINTGIIHTQNNDSKTFVNILPDIIFYNNQECIFDTRFTYYSPFENYFYLNKNNLKNYNEIVQLLRQKKLFKYKTIWEIKGNKLILKNIISEDDNVNLDLFFQHKGENIFAEWFTGYILIKVNPVKNEINTDIKKIIAISYQDYIFIKLKKGIIIDEFHLSNEKFEKQLKNQENPPEIFYKYYEYISGFNQEINNFLFTK